MNNKQYYVYFMTNYEETTLYIGVTNSLERRIYEHKNKLMKGFTQRYNLTKLIYYEIFEDIEFAIQREKQLKKWLRQRKISLISKFNKDWLDLYCENGQILTLPSVAENDSGS
ncbi:MAG: GIY-YIG nuclease family protein [bacterium]